MKKAVLFLLILLLALGLFNRVLSYKSDDGTNIIERFYALDANTVDVLALGSSHIFENVNPAILWKERGIACYDLCGSMQPMWNTYYYLLEALKTQSPKLVVLDVFSAVAINEDYGPGAWTTKNVFGMKPSKEKLRSLWVSVAPADRIDYLLEFPVYHTRYGELTAADFSCGQGSAAYRYSLGYSTNFATEALERPPVETFTDMQPLHEKSGEYLEKIMDACAERGIPLLLIATPHAVGEVEQERYNTIAAMAAERGLLFINYNLLYDALSLDFSTDFGDYSHLNYLGNVKFSKHLAATIAENYDVADRRGHAGYALWEDAALYYERAIANHGADTRTLLSEYLMAYRTGRYRAILSLPYTAEYCAEDLLQFRGVGLSDEQIAEGGYFLLAENARPARISIPVSVDVGQKSYSLDSVLRLYEGRNSIAYLGGQESILLLIDDVTETLAGYAGFAFDADGRLARSELRAYGG